MLRSLSYEGSINPGMRFRHISFDITCEVEEITGMHVVVRSVDTRGTKAPETMALQAGQFRQNWRYVLPRQL